MTLELGLAIGVFGVWVFLWAFNLWNARAALRTGGPDAMTVVFVRLRRFHVKARHARIIAIGFLCLSPLWFPILLGFDAFSPWAIARRRDSPCRRLVSTEQLAALTGLAPGMRVHDDGEWCHASWEIERRPGPSESLLTIEMRRQSMVFGAIDEQLRREGRKVEPVEKLDGYLGRKGHDRVLVFDRRQIHVKVEFGEALDERAVAALIEAVAADHEPLQAMARR